MSPSPSIARRIAEIEAELPQGVALVAVSKYHPPARLLEAYQAGARRFAESRVQELVQKHEALHRLMPEAQWHFIGPLQRNKVKYLIPLVDLIESVSSKALLQEIELRASKIGRRVKILLEVHIAREQSKGGFTPEEIIHLLEEIRRGELPIPHLSLCGLMTIATHTEDEAVVGQEFDEMKQLFDRIIAEGLAPDPTAFTELSMGMSGDYPLAIARGATLVRIGQAIFGERN